MLACTQILNATDDQIFTLPSLVRDRIYELPHRFIVLPLDWHDMRGERRPYGIQQVLKKCTNPSKATERIKTERSFAPFNEMMLVVVVDEGAGIKTVF